MSRLALLVGLVACGDNSRPVDLPYFMWNGERSVGAMDLDHLAANDIGMIDQIDTGIRSEWVVMFYGHVPGTAYDTIEAFLARAKQDGLPFLTYADLAAGGSHRAGVSLSFDDTEVDQWFAMRDLFARYEAHVSFFCAGYYAFTQAERDELHVLYSDGNTMEAHSVHHPSGVDYVAQYGLDAYIADEVEPSIDILRADGFTPVAYAHPGGAHDPEIDAAILEHTHMIRSISGAPKPVD